MKLQKPSNSTYLGSVGLAVLFAPKLLGDAKFFSHLDLSEFHVFPMKQKKVTKSEGICQMGSKPLNRAQYFQK